MGEGGRLPWPSRPRRPAARAARQQHARIAMIEEEVNDREVLA